MFDCERIPIRIADVRHEMIERDEDEVGVTVLTCEINPFTAELAADLDEQVRAILFTRQDAVVSPKVRGVVFELSERPQEVQLRAAPDQSKASLHIVEAKIGPYKARRSKKSSEWRLVFTVTFAPASKEQLASAVDGRLKMRYATFTDATPDLFSEDEKTQKRARRSAPATAAATAH